MEWNELLWLAEKNILKIMFDSFRFQLNKLHLLDMQFETLLFKSEVNYILLNCGCKLLKQKYVFFKN